MKKVVFLLLAGVLGGFIALASYKMLEKSKYNRSNSSLGSLSVQPASYMPHSPVDGPDFIAAAEKSIHAVVHIKTEYQQKSNVYDSFFRDLFGDYNQGGERPYSASGSGVILSEDGYIITNNHVVQDADYIEVTLNDKRSYQAEIIGTDPTTDLALIKINEKGLTFLNYGNSDNLRIGEWVLAVGNPFNLTSTVTAGIVSAKARNINILGTRGAIESFIQTDAVVNPGNSGGALVNTNGELVGINAAIASNTGTYTGYSFAIPVNIVRKVAEDMIKFGTVQRGFIGVTPVDIDSEFARNNGLKDTKGVYVYGVSENGSAHEAGITKGDIIEKVNNIPVNSVAELLEIIGQHRPGENVHVLYARNGNEKEADLTLRNKEGNTKLVKKEDHDVLGDLGATLEPISQDEKQWYHLESGLKVMNMKKDGLLARADMRENFIITAVDKRIVKTREDVEKALMNKKGGVLVEGMYPNRMRGYYLIVIKG